MSGDRADKIGRLEKELEALRRQWPAHSASPTLLQRLDDLEVALAAAKASQDDNIKDGG
ncbi:MAG: hypothetical protein GY803_22055 [Chloroflexi bacterium]|nr:hypothetical protein [Chloroflexota bacterium]